MDLIHTPTSDTCLVICPEKYGNLARFISGINNHYKEMKKKKNQNVYSFRVDIDGSVHILLLASKRIKKGETYVRKEILCFFSFYRGDIVIIC